MCDQSFWLRFWLIVATVVCVLMICTTAYWMDVNHKLETLISEGACPIEAKYALEGGYEGDRVLLQNHNCSGE